MEKKKRKPINKHIRRFLIFISFMAICFVITYAYQSFLMINDGRYVTLDELYERSFKAREEDIYFTIEETHVRILALEYRGDFTYEFVEGTFFVFVPDIGQQTFLMVMANANLSIYMSANNIFLYEVK